MHGRFPAAAAGCLLLGLAIPAGAVPPESLAPAPTAPQEPVVAAASDEPQRALAAIRSPLGLAGQVVAAEPLVANIVAFFVDGRGRIYVCETFRQGQGVEDNRNHGGWVADDIASRTLADRLAYMKKHLGTKIDAYTLRDDRIRLLVDADGDGTADDSRVFADRFNGILDGTGAGVLAHRDTVYYTNIPRLYALKDGDGDGRSDDRAVLSEGYGVRFAYRGHDMHGLVIGPDGRLYFSIGDRGLDVRQGDRHLANPESGAVLRCELDGSNLEIFATGLRNPQELAFDDHGNLFTGDNNSDSGDQARLVHVVEGGDSGWRMAYQYLGDRGPFNREKIWHAYDKGATPASIVPPVHVGICAGPSGFAAYPGTGLPESFAGRFLLCDFRGGPDRSAVRSFRIQPQGAFFRVEDQKEVLGNVLATDVDFGPDGAIYVSDWVQGWDGTGKGRIYKFFDPASRDSAPVKQVAALLAAGFASRPTAELRSLLAHADRRIRREAQFALADRKDVAGLTEIARGAASRLARLHALWGLGQIARRGDTAAVGGVDGLLDDDDAEVRAQTARLLGDCGIASATAGLIATLGDASPRVRAFAAMGLGKLAAREALPAVVQMLAADAGADPILRHAGIMALAGVGDVPGLVALGGHSSADVRLAAVVALRRRGAAEAATFLADAVPRVVLEAARAINDTPIEAALPKLAALITTRTASDPLLRRILNANFRLGTPEAAVALARFAADSAAPEPMRLEALSMLGEWAAPGPRDRVVNIHRPLPARSADPALAALRAAMPGVLAGSPQVAQAAAQLAAKWGMGEVAPALHATLADTAQPAAARADALRALAAIDKGGIDATVGAALTDREAAVRAAARQLLFAKKPADTLPLLAEAVERGAPVERQQALLLLGPAKLPGAREIVSAALDRLQADDFPAEARLELVEAAGRQADGPLKEKLAAYAKSKSAHGPLADYLETLAGGDAARGRTIFHEKVEVSCVRCHKAGAAGGEVGPDLARIGAEKSREYLLESIVVPNKAIARTFESLQIVTDDGLRHVGVVRREDAKTLELLTPEGKTVTIPVDSIEDRRPAKSAMPEDLVRQLSKQELRDLVEFLAGLR
jgi:quinoprotein glucose dehydrogenase